MAAMTEMSGRGDAPLISVVTAAYNGERYLRRAMESLRAQSLPSWECLVLDDGSRDDTRRIAEEIAAADSRVRVLIQPRHGVAATRNRGARAAHPHSRYLLFLDPEDALRPDALARLYERLEAGPTPSTNTAAAFGGAVCMDENDHFSPTPLPPVRLRAEPGGVVLCDADNLGFAHIIAACPIFSPGQCLIRRAAFVATGGFDPNVAHCYDWDFYLRLTCDGATLDHIEEETLEWREHSGDAARRKHTLREAKKRLFRRWMRSREASPEQRTLARAAFAYAMYGFDADVCRQWARSAAADRDWRAAGFNLLRAIRMEAAALPVRVEALLTSTALDREDALAAT